MRVCFLSSIFALACAGCQPFAGMQFAANQSHLENVNSGVAEGACGDPLPDNAPILCGYSLSTVQQVCPEEPCRAQTPVKAVQQEQLCQRYVSGMVLPPNAAGIAPGLGVDLSDPLFPVFKNGGPEGLATDTAVPHKSSLQTKYTQATSVDEEASHLAAYFKASFLIGSATAAYRKAEENLKKSEVFYITLEENTSAVVCRGRPMWEELSDVDKQPTADEKLTVFLHMYGSHYISKVYYGRKIVIRAATTSKDQAKLDSFRAALNAGFLGFGANGGVDQGATARLKEADVSIEASIVGTLEPEGAAAALLGVDAVNEFVAKFKAEQIKINPVPVSVDLEGYWFTLTDFPELRKLLHPNTRFLSNDDVATLSALVGERLTKELKESAKGLLGSPEQCNYENEYIAETDGFVVASSVQDEGPNQISIVAKPKGGDWETRTTGAIAPNKGVAGNDRVAVISPIRKGETWKVVPAAVDGKKVRPDLVVIIWTPLRIQF